MKKECSALNKRVCQKRSIHTEYIAKLFENFDRGRINFKNLVYSFQDIDSLDKLLLDEGFFDDHTLTEDEAKILLKAIKNSKMQNLLKQNTSLYTKLRNYKTI